MKAIILRLSISKDTKTFIDDKQRFEAERALTDPTERDIDDYLFLHNTVVEMRGLQDKINQMAVKINEILDKIDPPTP